MNLKQLGLSVSALTLVATSVMAASPQQVSNNGLERAVEIAQEKAGRYIIVFKPGAGNYAGTEKSRSAQGSALMSEGVLNAKAAASAVERAGGKFLKSIDKKRMVVANLNKKAYNALLKSKDVESISVDAKRYLLAQSEPFGIAMVQANQLSQSNKTNRKVCIIDTGYDLGHEDLPTDVTGQANNGSVGVWSNDGHGHGTHVAGTIAALDNSTGVVGVHPDMDLHIVKIFNDSGSWTAASDLILGIQQCVDAGADIVSMSLGGGAPSGAEENAMNGFVNNDGVMLIAAAGNDGNSSMSYPASYDAVMSVAAVDSSANVASFSQFNSQVEIAAPGVAVNSTLPGDTYAAWNGTSMATPHVSGVAALVWSHHLGCSNEQIRAAINASSQDRGAAGRDNFYGWGIAKALDAHNYLTSWGCAGDPDWPPTGGGGGGDPYEESYSNLSGSTGSWRDWLLAVPSGAAVMTATMSGGTGDADLYTRYNAFPQTYAYDCRPYLIGNNESCTHSSPAAGDWYVSIRAYSTYSGVSLTFGYE